MVTTFTLAHFRTPQTQGHNKKPIHLDQTIPGVAFGVKCHIPVQEFRLDAMSKWTQNGRLYAIQIFAQQKWITCFNAYAPTQNSAPFLEDLSQTLGEYAHKSSILFGDINADSCCGFFVQEMNDKGWYSLTQDTNYDFYTYKHSNGNTSCIDTIAVADLLKETVAPIQSTSVLDKGHSFLSTSMHSSFQQKPTWEVYHQVCFCTGEDNEAQWQQALVSHRPKMNTTNLDQDWNVWWEALQTIHNPEGAVIRLQPRFRLRDQFMHSKLHEQLSHAIKTQDWQVHTTILSKLQQISKNQLSGLKIFLDGLGPRAAPPPIPSCIESKKYVPRALKAKNTVKKGTPLVFKIHFKRLPTTFLSFTKASTPHKMNKMFVVGTTSATLSKSLTSIVASKKSFLRLMPLKWLGLMDLKLRTSSNFHLRRCFSLHIFFISRCIKDVYHCLG